MIGKLTMNSDVGVLICLLTLLLAIFSLYWRLKYHIFHVKKQNVTDIYELRQKLPTLDTEPKFIQDMEFRAVPMFQELTLEQVKFLMQKNLSLQLMTNISLLMKHDLCRLENDVLVIPKSAYINKKYLFNIKNILVLFGFIFFTVLFMDIIFSKNFTIIEFVCLLSLTLVMEFYVLLLLKGMIIYKHIIKMKQAISDIELRAEDNFDGKNKVTSSKISDIGKKKTSWFSQKLADLKQWEKQNLKQEVEETPVKKVWKTEKPTVIKTQSAKNKRVTEEELLVVDETISSEEKTNYIEDNVVSIEDYLLDRDEIDKQVQEDLQKIQLDDYKTPLEQTESVTYQYQEDVQQQPVAYETETEYQYQEDIQQQQPVTYESETEYQYQEDIQQQQPVAYESETEYQYQEDIQQQPVTYETETEYQYQEDIQQQQPVAYETETEYQYQEDIQQQHKNSLLLMKAKQNINIKKNRLFMKNMS